MESKQVTTKTITTTLTIMVNDLVRTMSIQALCKAHIILKETVKKAEKTLKTLAANIEDIRVAQPGTDEERKIVRFAGKFRNVPGEYVVSNVHQEYDNASNDRVKDLHKKGEITDAQYNYIMKRGDKPGCEKDYNLVYFEAGTP